MARSSRATAAVGIAAAAGLVGVRIATPPPEDHVALLYHGSGTEVDDAIREGFDLAAVDGVGEYAAGGPAGEGSGGGAAGRDR